MRDPQGRLIHSWRAGKGNVARLLEDYACVARALVDLYETDFDPTDLTWATQLAGRAIERFEDRDSGGFFSTPPNQPAFLVKRTPCVSVGVEPSRVCLSSAFAVAEAIPIIRG